MSEANEFDLETEESTESNCAHIGLCCPLEYLNEQNMCTAFLKPGNYCCCPVYEGAKNQCGDEGAVNKAGSQRSPIYGSIHTFSTPSLVAIHCDCTRTRPIYFLSRTSRHPRYACSLILAAMQDPIAVMACPKASGPLGKARLLKPS